MRNVTLWNRGIILTLIVACWIGAFVRGSLVDLLMGTWSLTFCSSYTSVWRLNQATYRDQTAITILNSMTKVFVCVCDLHSHTLLLTPSQTTKEKEKDSKEDKLISFSPVWHYWDAVWYFYHFCQIKDGYTCSTCIIVNCAVEMLNFKQSQSSFPKTCFTLPL